MDFPTDRQYLNSHEWVVLNDDTATVGITDYAQDELGDIVYVNLPEAGEAVVKGEPFADVESVKAVSEIISPVSGVVSAVNEDVVDDPGLINKDPYESWIIEVNQVTETASLLDADAYKAFCEQQS